MEPQTLTERLVCCLGAALLVGALYTLSQDSANNREALRRYVEQSRDPATRQQAQREYFGHDVETPMDLFERIRAEAREAEY